MSNPSRKIPKLGKAHKSVLLNLGILLLYKYSFRVYYNDVVTQNE
nr:MAG TPA: hypothetical protein [Caudoviricetes sp.]